MPDPTKPKRGGWFAASLQQSHPTIFGGEVADATRVARQPRPQLPPNPTIGPRTSQAGLGQALDQAASAANPALYGAAKSGLQSLRDLPGNVSNLVRQLARPDYSVGDAVRDLRESRGEFAEGKPLGLIGDFTPVLGGERAVHQGAQLEAEGHPGLGRALAGAGVAGTALELTGAGALARKGVQLGARKLIERGARKQLLAELGKEGGATLTATGKPFKGTAYMVARPELTATARTPAEIEAFINRPDVKKAISSGAHYGTWTDPATGITELNVSDAITSKARAHSVGVSRGQKAVGHIQDGAYQGDINLPALRKDAVPELARIFGDDFGGNVPHELPEIDQARAREMASAYDKLPTNDPNARGAYEALNSKIAEQRAAFEKAGYRFEYVDQDPYKSSAEMLKDVRENKRLKVLKTNDKSEHPFMSREQNDAFRGVHDMTHAAAGLPFGPKGEEAAARLHASTMPGPASRALLTETRGQNSWVNFGPNAHLPPTERPFAPQKAALWPEEYTGPGGQAPGFGDAFAQAGDDELIGAARNVGDLSHYSPEELAAEQAKASQRLAAFEGTPVSAAQSAPAIAADEAYVAALRAEQARRAGSGGGLAASGPPIPGRARRVGGDVLGGRADDLQGELGYDHRPIPGLPGTGAVEAPAQPEKVVGAAYSTLKDPKTGKFYTGFNHADAREQAKAAGLREGFLESNSGFVTNTGRFVTRKEAADLALEAGQMGPKGRGRTQLLSEHVKRGELGSIPGPWQPTSRGVFNRSAAPIQGSAPIDPRLAVRMPRAEPSELASAIADSKVVERGLQADVEKGLPLGGDRWYEGGPVAESFGELGGPFSFHDFNLARGSASIQAPTHLEIPTATGLLFGRRQGLNSLKEIKAAHQRMYPGEPSLWGTDAGSYRNYRRAVDADIQLPSSPGSAERKVPWYTQGNEGGAPGADVAIDKHEGRRLLQLAATDRRISPLLKKLGITNVSGPRADVVPVLNGLDYSLLSSPYRRIADRMGLASPQQAQAGRWIGGAELTGLKSQPTGDFTQTLEDVLLHTANVRGLPTDPAGLQSLWGRAATGQDILSPRYGNNPLQYLYSGQGSLFGR